MSFIMKKILPPLKNNDKIERALVRKLRYFIRQNLSKSLFVFLSSFKEDEDININDVMYFQEELLDEESVKIDIYSEQAEDIGKWFILTYSTYALSHILKNLGKIPLNTDIIAAIEQQRWAVINLIKTIPQKYFSLVKQSLNDFLLGNLKTSLKQRLKDIYKITDNRAKLIARDQTNKTNSILAQELYKAEGITTYIWQTMDDERVAGNPSGLYPKIYPSQIKTHGNHWKRNGQVFSFDNPPEDGHPGMGIQCRCLMQPIIK